MRSARGISAHALLRLDRDDGMLVQFCTGIQTHSEVELAKVSLGHRLEREVEVLAPA